jgi:protein DGCR14
MGNTPGSVTSSITTTTQTSTTVKIDTNMSLDKFQSLYTSEDNESFYKLLDKQNQKRAEKYAWMWSGNNQMPSKMMLKQKEIEAKLLLSRGSLQDDGGVKDRLAIRDTSEKPARPDAWKSKPMNEFMFAPEGIQDSMETAAQRAQKESRAEPKGVSYANTRMCFIDVMVENHHTTPASPSMSAIRDAIDGHRRPSDLESGFHGSETPRVNGYAFVDDEPESDSLPPAPVINFSTGDDVKNPFVIKEQSKREDLHHRMVDKNAKTKRASFKIGMTGKVTTATPVPKFPSSPRVGAGQLTPAAQRLWSKVGTRNGESSDAFGGPNKTPRPSGLRARWTPIREKT